jgi:ribosomal protein S1
MENEDLFYHLIKDSPLRFKINCLVDAKIIKVNQRLLVCKILENGLIGNISLYDALDQPESSENLQRKFQEGEMVRAKVKHINYKEFKVELALRSSEMKLNKFSLKEMFSNWHLMDKYFKIGIFKKEKII